jgi:RNAse (barnase) inhibitor barstar
MHSLAELKSLSTEQKRAKLDALADSAKSTNANPLEAEIKDFEEKHGMTSQEMKRRVAVGELKETPEISEWQYLLNASFIQESATA